MLFHELIYFHTVVFGRKYHDCFARPYFVNSAGYRICAAICGLRVIVDTPASKENERFRGILIYVSRFSLASCDFLKEHLPGGLAE